MGWNLIRAENKRKIGQIWAQKTQNEGRRSALFRYNPLKTPIFALITRFIELDNLPVCARKSRKNANLGTKTEKFG